MFYLFNVDVKDLKISETIRPEKNKVYPYREERELTAQNVPDSTASDTTENVVEINTIDETPTYDISFSGGGIISPPKTQTDVEIKLQEKNLKKIPISAKTSTEKATANEDNIIEDVEQEISDNNSDINIDEIATPVKSSVITSSHNSVIIPPTDIGSNKKTTKFPDNETSAKLKFGSFKVFPETSLTKPTTTTRVEYCNRIFSMVNLDTTAPKTINISFDVAPDGNIKNIQVNRGSKVLRSRIENFIENGPKWTKSENNITTKVQLNFIKP